MTSSSLILCLLCLLSTSLNVADAAGGSWKQVLAKGGVSAMHMQLLTNDRVIIFDRQDFGQSQIMLPKSKCDPAKVPGTTDCSAHSVEYNVAANTVRPLMIQTDVWCSSGSVDPSGRLIQTGGNGAGSKVVRTMQPCTNGCDWAETPGALLAQRWYASVQILPSGEEIIIGGRAQFNFEFYPKNTFNGLYSLPFLSDTNDQGIENNLYPFTFLNTDDNMFIFANNRAILLDYKNNQVVKTYPTVPGGDPRSYPSTGSAAFLPLTNLEADNIVTEVLVCGGAPIGSYVKSLRGNFVTALNTCARMKLNDAAPAWVVETMPSARVMGDMTLLPNGDVLIVNGAGKGAAGWESADAPVLAPVLYHPDNALGSRFETQNPARAARLYHSTAILLRDGRVLVGGSNPHAHYNFTNVKFPTEVSLDTFSPSYLDATVLNLRPAIDSPVSLARVGYAKQLDVTFTIQGAADLNRVEVVMMAPTFTTHSFSMNQRMLVLTKGTILNLGNKTYRVPVTTPKSGVLAPPGYYFLFVVHQGVPSVANWIHIQ
uniref:Galactose oxidase n=1 Tax=Kalanchoe fedtschenkoi TaxID=63787 RepID=A0A7N0RBN9_KALFE